MLPGTRPDLEETGPGVFYARTALRLVSAQDIAWLKQRALQTPQKRARICLHRDPQDTVQEMVIAVHRDSYIAPHFHPSKEESFHVIEGRARAVFFSATGSVDRIVALAPSGTCTVEGGECCYYRIAKQSIHGLRIESEWLVFHEAAQGPFTSDSNAVPDWVPRLNSDAEGLAWLDAMIRKGIAL